MGPTRPVEAPPTHPRDGLSTSRRGSALPPDLVREASRRLGILALVFLVLSLLNLTLAHVTPPQGAIVWSATMDVLVGSIALMSLGVLLYARWGRSNPASVITLGLVYEVAVAAALAVIDHKFVLTAEMTITPALSVS